MLSPGGSAAAVAVGVACVVVDSAVVVGSGVLAGPFELELPPPVAVAITTINAIKAKKPA